MLVGLMRAVTCIVQLVADSSKPPPRSCEPFARSSAVGSSPRLSRAKMKIVTALALPHRMRTAGSLPFTATSVLAVVQVIKDVVAPP
ncbi:hypothetical protein Dimus_015694, partial [Dionaea muscipula]